jgi:hypothetical protein
MVGRLHSAARAVELGFDIERDDGPSGNLRHWRIAGTPEKVCETFSKRSDEIAEHLGATGQSGYRARGIAARATRAVKRHTGADELLPHWQAELKSAGWSIDKLAAHLAASQMQARSLPFLTTTAEIGAIAADVLDIDGRLLANHKVFTRTNLVAEVALVSECDEVVVIRVSRDGGYLDRIRRRLDEQFDVGHEPVDLLAGAPAEELVSGQDSS